MASGQALPMIMMGKDRKWIFTEQAKKQLAGIDKPITPISIVGRKRGGKSFVLNQFDKTRPKFEISHSVKPCTKGIWMSPKEHPEVPGTYLLLLDTEGLSDVENEGDDKDVQIFALVLLLSTSLIINVTDVIDNTALKMLELASTVANRYQSKGGNGRFSGISPPPQLCVLIRNFQLELEGTPEQYLEEALGKRENIRDNFPDRKCFCLPTPTTPPREVERDIDFMRKCREVITTILSNRKYIKVGNKSLNGKQLAELCEQYVKVLNSEDLDIPSQRQAWIEKENRKVANDCLELYKAQMKTELTGKDILDERFLDSIHEKSKRTAIERYREHKFGTGTDTDAYESELETKIANQHRIAVQAIKPAQGAQAGNYSLVKAVGAGIARGVTEGLLRGAISGISSSLPTGASTYSNAIEISRQTEVPYQDIARYASRMSIHQALNSNVGGNLYGGILQQLVNLADQLNK